MASRPYSSRRADFAGALLVAALVLPVFTGAAWPGTASAASTGREALGKEKLPTVVTARTLTADNKQRVIIYKTNVVVKRGDVTLYADEVVIRLSESKKSAADEKDASGEPFTGAGSVETIEARGGVRVVQQDKTATSDKALYRAGDEKIVMTGSPRVWQGQNVLTGTTIVFNIQDDTISVEDAKTVLYQDEDAKGKSGDRAK